MIDVKIRTSKCSGFRVDPDGNVSDFDCVLDGNLRSLRRASAVARRKYHDSSITITNVETAVDNVKVDIDELKEIAK